MKKDAYYFPHFCNARHDRKVKRVMKELGIEGYGIFFMLLETLREQSGFRYPMEDIDLLADEFGTSEQKLRTVICNYGLFNIEDDKSFFSPKLIVYLKPYLEKSERARSAALLRWNNEGKQEDNANAYANAMQMQCGGNASKVKKSKVKKSKEEKSKEEEKEGFSPSCPHQQIIDLYHETLPSLPAVRTWGENRKAMLLARWRESEEFRSVEFWRGYFIRVSRSGFLMGRKKDFRADLEWLIKPTNFARVIEGRYDDRENSEKVVIDYAAGAI